MHYMNDMLSLDSTILNVFNAHITLYWSLFLQLYCTILRLVMRAEQPCPPGCSNQQRAACEDRLIRDCVDGPDLERSS